MIKKLSQKFGSSSPISSYWTLICLMNGTRTANEILRASRSTKIVFLSVHDTRGTMKAACMWADGFGAKSAAGIELIPTLCSVGGNRSTARQKDKD